MNVSVFTVIFWMFLGSVSAEIKITAVEGETVSLSCKAPDNKEIVSVAWTRDDLKEEKKHVFFYDNGHIELAHQHPSYKNRVELKDKSMTDGDVTLVLKNVRLNDSGMYECFIVQRATESRGENNNFISTINLSVESSGGRRDQTGGTEDRSTAGRGTAGSAGRGQHGLIVSVVLVVVLVAIMQP